VETDSGRRLRVRPINLQSVPPFSAQRRHRGTSDKKEEGLHVGESVRIIGLVNAPSLNGKEARVLPNR